MYSVYVKNQFIVNVITCDSQVSLSMKPVGGLIVQVEPTSTNKKVFDLVAMENRLNKVENGRKKYFIQISVFRAFTEKEEVDISFCVRGIGTTATDIKFTTRREKNLLESIRQSIEGENSLGSNLLRKYLV